MHVVDIPRSLPVDLEDGPQRLVFPLTLVLLVDLWGNPNDPPNEVEGSKLGIFGQIRMLDVHTIVYFRFDAA